MLLFAGLVFAKRYRDGPSWVDALTVFAAYCAASSAAYLVNDVTDAERDRAHPVKRFRPVAARAIPAEGALALAAVLAAVGFGLTVLIGPLSTGLLAAFVALQLAYSFALKRLVLLDVVALSGLLVIRAAAGAVAIDVRLSPWFVLCSGLLALFLALAKRRAELVASAGAPAMPSRPALGDYSLSFIDQLIAIVTASTISACASTPSPRPIPRR